MVNRTVIQSPETGAEGPRDAEFAQLVDDTNAKLTGGDEGGASQAQGQGDAERPSWLPEKFNSPEDLAKAYAALEAKMGQQGATKQEGEEQGQQQEQQDASQATQEQAQETVEKAGLDWDALNAEYAEKGGLTDESYAKLEQAGIPRQMVDSYIAGQQALVERQINDVVSTVGGQDAYQELVQWAGKALSPDEIDAFNKVVDSGDTGQLKLAVQGLKARFDAVNGSDPKQTLRGDSGAATSGAVYGSIAELMADMNSAKYREDEAFRKQVEQKLARSNIL